MTQLDYIPRNQLVARLHSGWRLIPGHEYSVDEYAILMALWPDVEPLNDDEVRSVEEKFIRPIARGFKAHNFRLRSRCAYGHYLTVENVYTGPNGYSRCRACKRDQHRANMQRYRAEGRAYA